MNVGDIITKITSFDPENERRGSTQKRSHGESGDDQPDRKRGMKSHPGMTDQVKNLILEGDDDDMPEAMNELSLKKIILQFEKRVYKNQEMRIKYVDMPEKFMESEVALNDTLQEMHIMATVPHLYHILIDLNAVQSLLQLLNHDNTDISIAVVDLLQEMTDYDSVTETEDMGLVLIDALMAGQLVALLIQNMERLDESVKEESEGVHNTLSIIENITELKPAACVEAANQGLLQYLLKRLKAKIPFDANKLYCSEILAILLQNHNENRVTLGDIDGIDILLQQLAVYKRHDPSSPEEIEFMENLFNCLCSSLLAAANRDRFLRGEGLQLMNLMLREKKLSRSSAVKVLNHAMSGREGADNCQKFVDILGLRSIFPLFMKMPKANKKAGPSRQELEEHIISIVTHLIRNCTSAQKQRLISKFVENDHEKVDRLMELHFKYLEKMRMADLKIEKEKQDIKFFGGELDPGMEDEWYIQRLDAGLFSLQLLDFIMMEVSNTGPASVKQRVLRILNMRGGSVKTIKSIMREYAGNIGDSEEGAEFHKAEQDRIFSMLDKFTS